jgi:hypothetical protein
MHSSTDKQPLSSTDKQRGVSTDKQPSVSTDKQRRVSTDKQRRGGLAGGTARLPYGLQLYMRLVLLGTALTALALVYLHLRHVPLLEAGLWSSGDDRFGDLWHYRPLFQYFHTAQFFLSADRFAYPAPCAVLLAMLYSFGSQTHTVFNVALVGTMVLSAVLFRRALMRFGISPAEALLLPAVLALTSYPWHMLYDRGNLELFVYIFLAAGVWAYLGGRPVLAAALWGLAGAMKLYPLVVLAVFFQRHALRSLLAGAASAAAALVGSFWYVGPTIKTAALGTVSGLTGFVGHYAGSARRSELNFDHSILGSIKEVLSLNFLHLGQDWPTLGRVYEGVIAVVATIVYFRWVRRIPELNQLCLFLVALVLLTPISYDYTLVHTYLIMGIVAAAYLQATRAGRPFAGAKAYFIAFAVLATSQTWIHLRGLGINGIAKTIALLVIGSLLLRLPLTMGVEAEDAVAG